jgi:hypothetical protein
MRKLATIFTVLITAFTFGQNTIEKTIGEFSSLKVYDLIHVKMIKSDIDKVIITGTNAKNVQVVNKSGKLKIRMNLKEGFDGSNTTVTLYYTKIDLIDANEGAFITVQDVIKQFDLELKAQEGGTIKLNIDVTYSGIKAVTGGIIEVKGKSKNQKINLSTGAFFKGKNCQSENSEIIIKAAGEAHINATEGVEVRIRAGGDVYIYGNPKKVDESKVFGGRIKYITE